MRRILMPILCAALLMIASTTAFADGPGPIVLGVERTEVVLFFQHNRSIDAFIDLEKRSIAANGSMKDYLRDIGPLLRENKSSFDQITYTPKRVLRSWNGEKILDDGSFAAVPKVLVESTTMAVINGQVTKFTIYVISSDPPVKTE